MLWIQTEKIYIDENNEDIVKIHEKNGRTVQNLNLLLLKL